VYKRQVLPSTLNFNQDLDANRVGVRQVNVLSTKTEVTVSNKVQSGDGEIYDYDFDFAWFVEWSFDGPGGDPNSPQGGGFPWEEVIENLVAGKAFEAKAVDIYGLAVKDGIIKGRRIVGAD